MWYKASNGDTTKPAALDTTSSKIYAYARKEFEEIPASGEGEQIIPAHWEWMECKFPKEIVAIFQQTEENADNVDSLTEAILEMSEAVYGE